MTVQEVPEPQLANPIDIVCHDRVASEMGTHLSNLIKRVLSEIPTDIAVYVVAEGASSQTEHDVAVLLIILSKDDPDISWHAGLATRANIVGPHAEMAVGLRSEIPELGAASMIGNPPIEGWAIDDLSSVRSLLQRLNHSLTSAPQLTDEAVGDRLAMAWSDYKSALDSYAARAADQRRLAKQVLESEALLDQQRQSVSGSGDIELSQFYSEIATSESTAADKFRWWTIVLLVAALGVAVFFVIWAFLKHESESTSGLSRLVYEIPLILLALYLRRQESTHRARSRRAGEFAARLRTLNIFTEALDRETRNELRKAVGESILTGPPMLTAEKDRDNVDLDDLSKIADLLNKRQSG